MVNSDGGISRHSVETIDSLDSLSGERILQLMISVLSSKISTRCADPKPNKHGGRATNPNKQHTYRERVLKSFLRLMTREPEVAHIDNDLVNELYSALLVGSKNPGTAEEQKLALRAVASLAVYIPPRPAVLAKISAALRNLIYDLAPKSIKVAAIQSLTCVTLIVHPPPPPEYLESRLDYLLEIVKTNGASANCHGSETVVCAALEAWAFTATMTPLHGHSIEAMEVFSDMIEHTRLPILTLVASNIALLFEISRKLEMKFTEAMDEYEIFDLDVAPDPTTQLVLSGDPKKLAHRIDLRLAEYERMLASRPWLVEDAARMSELDYAEVSLRRDVGYGYCDLPAGSPELQDDYTMLEVGYSEGLNLDQASVLLDSWAVVSRVRPLRHMMGLGFSRHFSDIRGFLELPVCGLEEEEACLLVSPTTAPVPTFSGSSRSSSSDSCGPDSQATP